LREASTWVSPYWRQSGRGPLTPGQRRSDRRRRPSGEEVVDEEEDVVDVDEAVAVRVGDARWHRAAGEERVDEEEDVEDVELPVAVRVAAAVRLPELEERVESRRLVRGRRVAGL